MFCKKKIRAVFIKLGIVFSSNILTNTLFSNCIYFQKNVDQKKGFHPQFFGGVKCLKSIVFFPPRCNTVT